MTDRPALCYFCEKDLINCQIRESAPPRVRISCKTSPSLYHEAWIHLFGLSQNEKFYLIACGKKRGTYCPWSSWEGQEKRNSSAPHLQLMGKWKRKSCDVHVTKKSLILKTFIYIYIEYAYLWSSKEAALRSGYFNKVVLSSFQIVLSYTLSADTLSRAVVPVACSLWWFENSNSEQFPAQRNPEYQLHTAYSISL